MITHIIVQYLIFLTLYYLTEGGDDGYSFINIFASCYNKKEVLKSFNIKLELLFET